MSLEKYRACRCGSTRLSFVGHHDGKNLVIKEVYCMRCWRKIHPEPGTPEGEVKPLRIQRGED